MEYQSVTEVSEETGYSPQHIRLLIRRGILRARRAGGVWLVEKISVDEYLRSSPTPGPKKKSSTLEPPPLD